LTYHTADNFQPANDNLEALLPAFNISQLHDELGCWFWRPGNWKCWWRHSDCWDRAWNL